MKEFKFACPHCGQHLQCDEEFSGREITCPGCKVVMRIPPVPGRTAEYSPESGKTWATHVPSGDVAAPSGLTLRKSEPSKPAAP